MDILVSIARSFITVGIVIVIMAALACLFMLVFTFATSFDRTIHE